MGDERREEDLAQCRMDDESGDDIGEERQRQPLEDLEDQGVGDEELEAEDEKADRNHQPGMLQPSPGQQLAARGDCTEVGADVDRVGDEEGEDADPDQPGRKLPAQRDSEAHPGLERDAGAQLLHGGHQREGEEGGPEQPIAELAAHLRIGPDATGVVIAGACDQTRAQDLEVAQRALLTGGLESGPTLCGRPGAGQAGGVTLRNFIGGLRLLALNRPQQRVATPLAVPPR
jgi:hypothetical protein